MTQAPSTGLPQPQGCAGEFAQVPGGVPREVPGGRTRQRPGAVPAAAPLAAWYPWADKKGRASLYRGIVFALADVPGDPS